MCHDFSCFICPLFDLPLLNRWWTCCAYVIVARWGPAADGSDFFVFLEADLQKHHQACARLDPFGSLGGWCQYQQSSIHGNLKSIWFQDRLAGWQHIGEMLHHVAQRLFAVICQLVEGSVEGFWGRGEQNGQLCFGFYLRPDHASWWVITAAGGQTLPGNSQQDVCSIGDASPKEQRCSKVEAKDWILSLLSLIYLIYLIYLWVSCWCFSCVYFLGDIWLEKIQRLDAVHVPVSTRCCCSTSW